MKKRIYLDHAATTPLDKRVLAAMQPYFWEKYGNASSLHGFGNDARKAIEDARAKVARAINAEPSEVYFTSGGTESDNIALRGIASANNARGNHIITTKIEHHAVMHTAGQLEKEGFEVTYIPVSREGIVSPADVEKAITEKTVLVSVMHANNEIGTIQPIEKIGKICKSRGIYFHTDAVQTVGKLEIDVNKMNADLLSASAHKFYGPKGVGFLYARKGTEIMPIVWGGAHERGLRSGTENVPGIVGLGKALELAVKEMKAQAKKEEKLRGKLIKGALKIPDSWLNGSRKQRLSGNANLGFSYIEGEALVLRLNDKGIAASTGSACSSKDLMPSHVLLAIGLKHWEAHGSLRITFGKQNTMAEINFLLGVLPKEIEKLREISPLRKGTDWKEFEEEVEEKIEERHGHEH